MNKKTIYGFLTLSLLLASCGEKNNSNSTSNSNTTDQSSSPSSEVVDNFKSIDDVSELFLTYESDEEFDFSAIYNCAVISNREFQGEWTTEYSYDGINLLLSYDANGNKYNDYYIYDETKNQMIYYIDSGSGDYQYLDEDNEEYFNYVSLIDYFELDGIEWEENMVFDLENHVCKPKNDIAKDEVGRLIFGDNAHEYWESIEISWTPSDDENKGYISQVKATSIYQESVYYYTVTLDNHGFVAGSIEAPKNAIEYVDPNSPFFKDRETYTGVALTNEQSAALVPSFTNESNMNYTVDVRWNLVVNSEISQSNYLDFHVEAENGNYFYSYADPSSPSLYHKYYLLKNGNSAPVLFYDDYGLGQYNVASSGMDEYESLVGQIYIDRIRLYGLNPTDFIYDEEKGYITAKDAETEAKYVSQLFFYTESYAGLRIYLKENGDGLFVIDKIETSMIAQIDDAGTVASFVKTYTFTNLGTTKIDYPDGVTLS